MGGVSVELATFDVLVELAIAVDKAEGVSHLVEDGGEKVVFACGCAIGGGLEVGVCSSELTIIPWGGVDEPADFISVVIDQDSCFSRCAICAKSVNLCLS